MQIFQVKENFKGNFRLTNSKKQNELDKDIAEYEKVCKLKKFFRFNNKCCSHKNTYLNQESRQSRTRKSYKIFKVKLLCFSCPMKC
ncbi:unnamed protein product [Moneuplotes crassus]|uniref:Uncharacterized protein n=1 Tax=Euplotes crassus TaxID=5936 RepID=A0AAD1XQW6_EUPCR|nr:unnamed protein product [Moneuplotes crassus]